MEYYAAETINATLEFNTLMEVLMAGFKQEITVPARAHINYPVRDHMPKNTLLLMPAVQVNHYAGVKIVNVAPENTKAGLASIQGVYYLMDAVTGVPLALFDARSITNWRTAAASALASTFLSNLKRLPC